MTQDHAAIAQALVKGDPLSYKFYPDGSLVVIAPTGQKLQFTPEQVRAAEKGLKSHTSGRPKSAVGNTSVQKVTTRSRKSTKKEELKDD